MESESGAQRQILEAERAFEDEEIEVNLRRTGRHTVSRVTGRGEVRRYSRMGGRRGFGNLRDLGWGDVGRRCAFDDLIQLLVRHFA